MCIQNRSWSEAQIQIQIRYSLRPESSCLTGIVMIPLVFRALPLNMRSVDSGGHTFGLLFPSCCKSVGWDWRQRHNLTKNELLYCQPTVLNRCDSSECCLWPVFYCLHLPAHWLFLLRLYKWMRSDFFYYIICKTCRKLDMSSFHFQ